MTTLVASSYCLLNFWRCREAHCVVSGTGWAVLGIFETAEIALGRSLIHGNEGAAFVAILVLAVAFEAFWRTRHGTNALRAFGSRVMACIAVMLELIAELERRRGCAGSRA